MNSIISGGVHSVSNSRRPSKSKNKIATISKNKRDTTASAKGAKDAKGKLSTVSTTSRRSVASKSDLHVLCISDNKLTSKKLNKEILINTCDLIDFGGNSWILEGNSQHITYAIKAIITADIKKNKEEIKIMKKTSKLLERNRTRHFVKMYDYLFCSDNKLLLDNGTELSFNILMIMKRYRGHIVGLLFDDSIPLDLKKNIYAQVYLSLLSYHHFFNLLHNDAKPANFFYEVRLDYNEDQYYKYIIIINGVKYEVYLRASKYHVVIGDYGESTISADKSELKEDFAIIEEIGLKNRFFSVVRAIDKNDPKFKKLTPYQQYVFDLIHSTDLFDMEPKPNIIKIYSINTDQIIFGGRKKLK
jgi:hypothetical protein